MGAVMETKERNDPTDRALLVGGSARRREALRRALAGRGCEAIVAATEEEALRAVRGPERIGLALVDAASFGDGACAFVRALRHAAAGSPAILLELADFAVDAVDGALAAGADDCVPAHAPEVAAALVAARLRKRKAEFGDGSDGVPEEPLQRMVADLSPVERRVLRLLLESDGRTVSREEINRILFGGSGPVDSNAAGMRILRLRRKLGRLSAGIVTIRGEGFRWDAARPGRVGAAARVRVLLGLLCLAAAVAGAGLALSAGRDASPADGAESGAEALSRKPRPPGAPHRFRTDKEWNDWAVAEFERIERERKEALDRGDEAEAERLLGQMGRLRVSADFALTTLVARVREHPEYVRALANVTGLRIPDHTSPERLERWFWIRWWKGGFHYLYYLDPYEATNDDFRPIPPPLPAEDEPETPEERAWGAAAGLRLDGHRRKTIAGTDPEPSPGASRAREALAP